MAANIFDSGDYQSIKARIDKLNPTSPAQWGKMSVDQMLRHCAIQLQMGLGKIENKSFEGPGLFRTAFGRWAGLYAFPWPKGSNTPSKMDMSKNEVSVDDFESEKKLLLELLELVQASKGLKPHPFFGAMEKKDWGRLIWKHLDHHLNQFGN
ncbi:MAG: DUF1569 domain-containing protein [Bacteroidia bacterium]|nr:DUF1569 domain-containing protein [Bacteroidia bacterium]